MAYKVTCKFCQTEVRGPHGGSYQEFVKAVKAIKIHWRISCGSAPVMNRHEKDVVAEGSVAVVER